MNESIHSFWYRPFWQQTLPVWLFTSLCLITGYFLYWEKSKSQLNALTTENVNLIEKITKETELLQRSPSFAQLEQRIQLLKQTINVVDEPVELVTQLNDLLIQSAVTLNQLQPINDNTYFMEFQGDFIHIYRFIEQLLTHPNVQRWHFNDIRILLKQGVIVTSISFSLFNSTLDIKDDNRNE